MVIYEIYENVPFCLQVEFYLTFNTFPSHIFPPCRSTTIACKEPRVIQGVNPACRIPQEWVHIMADFNKELDSSLQCAMWGL